jgi:hypothetical protein
MLIKHRTVERWEELCEKAAVEKDPQKLIALVKQINRLLAENEVKLKSASDERNSSQ